MAVIAMACRRACGCCSKAPARFTFGPCSTNLRRGTCGSPFTVKNCRRNNMLKKGLQALLKNDATIAAAVGPRVRIGRIPEGTSYPVIVLHVISPEYFISLQGVNATQAKIVQINCWAKTPKGADEVAQAVHNLLDGHRAARDRRSRQSRAGTRRG